jgi:phosphohistidine swiveling domain-containing protein
MKQIYTQQFIPAVLNVPLATQSIPDGSSILLDGAQGMVQVLTPS